MATAGATAGCGDGIDGLCSSTSARDPIPGGTTENLRRMRWRTQTWTPTFVQSNGRLWLRVTRGRAQAVVDALDIALDSGAASTGGGREPCARCETRWLASPPASGLRLSRFAGCMFGPTGVARRFGHARDLQQRQKRNTNSPQRLRLVAAWRFESVEEAMKRETEARKRYVRAGDGGREWVDAEPTTIVEDLTQLSGAPLA